MRERERREEGEREGRREIVKSLQEKQS